MVDAIYDEIVIGQESQILPVFMISLSSLNFKNLSQRWDRAVPEGSTGDRTDLLVHSQNEQQDDSEVELQQQRMVEHYEE